MNKHSFLFLAIGLCTFAAGFAQVVPAATTINGSPYLNDGYSDGVIQYAVKFTKTPLRYNIYQDVIEYQQNKVPMALDASETIKKVRIDDITLVPEKYDNGGKPKMGYFQLLDSGKVTLYVKKKVIFLQAKKGGALDGSDQPAEYKRSADMYYYKTHDGVLHELESIKSMIATLADKQDELTQFAKKEKISPRKEKEVIQFVKYYNSLAEN